MKKLTSFHVYYGANLSKNFLWWLRSNNEGGGLNTQNISNRKINLS